MYQNSKILVVEDDINTQKMWGSIFEQEGFSISIALDGEVGVERALKEDFCCILMDIDLPKIDGITAIKTIRQNGLDIPIIVTTSKNGDEIRNNCYEAGCSQFFHKSGDKYGLVQQLKQRNPGKCIGDDCCETSQEEGERNGYLISRYEDDAHLAPLIEGFLGRLPVRVESLISCFDQEDWNGFAKLSHQLKGALYSHGFMKLGQLLEEIEKDVKATPQRDLLKKKIDNLKNIFKY